jgi:hypothetical protein
MVQRVLGASAHLRNPVSQAPIPDDQIPRVSCRYTHDSAMYTRLSRIIWQIILGNLNICSYIHYTYDVSLLPVQTPIIVFHDTLMTFWGLTSVSAFLRLCFVFHKVNPMPLDTIAVSLWWRHAVETALGADPSYVLRSFCSFLWTHCVVKLIWRAFMNQYVGMSSSPAVHLASSFPCVFPRCAIMTPRCFTANLHFTLRYYWES